MWYDTQWRALSAAPPPLLPPPNLCPAPPPRRRPSHVVVVVAGLSRAQCEWMTKTWHVYLTMDGRISMAGLSASRCGDLADAIADAVLNH